MKLKKKKNSIFDFEEINAPGKKKKQFSLGRIFTNGSVVQIISNEGLLNILMNGINGRDIHMVFK